MSDTPQNMDRRALLKDAVRALDEMQAKLAAMERSRTEPIAIVGMGCRFPGGADSPDAYWTLLRNGVDAITEVPADRWSPERYVELDAELAAARPRLHGGFLKEIDRFDAGFFGISRREAVSMDPQHRLVLEVCWKRSAYRRRGRSAAASPAFVGITVATGAHGRRIRAPRRLHRDRHSHNAAPALRARPSGSGARGRHDLLVVFGGRPPVRLRLGENTALAGGVSTMHNPDAFFAFHKWGFMAADGRCKTFDASADGFVRTEGCGVALKPARTPDDDNVVAIIRGSAISQMARRAGSPCQRPAQKPVIRQALRNGGRARRDRLRRGARHRHRSAIRSARGARRRVGGDWRIGRSSSVVQDELQPPGRRPARADPGRAVAAARAIRHLHFKERRRRRSGTVGRRADRVAAVAGVPTAAAAAGSLLRDRRHQRT